MVEESLCSPMKRQNRDLHHIQCPVLLLGATNNLGKFYRH